MALRSHQQTLCWCWKWTISFQLQRRYLTITAVFSGYLSNGLTEDVHCRLQVDMFEHLSLTDDGSRTKWQNSLHSAASTSNGCTTLTINAKTNSDAELRLAPWPFVLQCSPDCDRSGRNRGCTVGPPGDWPDVCELATRPRQSAHRSLSPRVPASTHLRPGYRSHWPPPTDADAPTLTDRDGRSPLTRPSLPPSPSLWQPDAAARARTGPVVKIRINRTTAIFGTSSQRDKSR